MSGPKRADVEAELGKAEQSKLSCANMISKADNAAIDSILREVERLLRDAEGTAARLQDAISGITGDMRRISPEGVGGLDAAGAGGRTAMETARSSLGRAREELDRARQQENAAQQTFNTADGALRQARQALSNADDGHYMHSEMALAQNAKRKYEEAFAGLAVAASTRRSAETAAADAQRRVREAKGGLEGGLQRAGSVRDEASTLLRAEQEAQRIAEEKRRSATMALDRARGAAQRVDNLPHAKFRPGGLDAIRQTLDEAAAALGGGRFDEARGAAEQALPALSRLEQEILEAQKEHERRKSSAESCLATLQSVLEGLDEELIQNWSSTPAACDEGRRAAARAQEAIVAERFEQAEEIAGAARQKLGDALKEAAETKSADERRISIGDAIMEVLDELNFDVSFNPGSRDQPLRISGQIATADGKGDFNLEIPITGEIDFEVDIPQGDTSCVGAVNELRNRLGKRGIKWETTDWGHAEGHQVQTPKVTIQATEKEQVKVQSKRS
jgi:tetratricopeptide (TPR) repeat protein